MVSDGLFREVAKELGPFVDCTSDQATAHHELLRTMTIQGSGEKVHLHETLILDSIAFVKLLETSSIDGSHYMNQLQVRDRALFYAIDAAELAVEVIMVKLALRMVPYLTGYSHVQTNPKYVYDEKKTVENGRRFSNIGIVALFTLLAPSSLNYHPQSRVCIRVPSTWEGIRACRTLRTMYNIHTSATTMFCKEQALLAANIGQCTYIAPCINEPRIHFEPEFVNLARAFDFPKHSQVYYEMWYGSGSGDPGNCNVDDSGGETEAIPRLWTSILEAMQLADSQHITISPPLLIELTQTSAKPWEGILIARSAKSWAGVTGSQARSSEQAWVKGIIENEERWRWAFARRMDGMAQRKLVQAIDELCEQQHRLEELVRGEQA